jgi:hypothetical protein
MHWILGWWSSITNSLDLSLCRPTLFEIQLGQVDRGATLRWISQFPGEDEVLLPPLSNLEVVGEPVMMMREGGAVNVCQLRVNVNLKVNPKPQSPRPRPQILNPKP